MVVLYSLAFMLVHVLTQRLLLRHVQYQAQLGFTTLATPAEGASAGNPTPTIVSQTSGTPIVSESSSRGTTTTTVSNTRGTTAYVPTTTFTGTRQDPTLTVNRNITTVATTPITTVTTHTTPITVVTSTTPTTIQNAFLALEDEFDAHAISDEIWQQVKLHYIGLLSNLHQPELAETFFNSVTTRILASRYFNNKFIFVRPTISTEYLENDEAPSKPSYRAYYPGDISGLRVVLHNLLASFELHNPFEDLERVSQSHNRVNSEFIS